MHRVGLKRMAVLLVAGMLAAVGGCEKSNSRLQPTGELLLLSFAENQPLHYRMVSERRTHFDLNGTESTQQSQGQIMTERLEAVMVYTPIEVDPFGLTVIRATCESAKVTRTAFTRRQNDADAMESLPQLSFTLTLTPIGQIEDRSDFERVVQQLGDKAFAQVSPTAGRVKNPDMISDFIAMQSYLWDTVASIDNPAKGVTVGKTWKTRQMLPWPSPVPNPPTRITTFALQDILSDEQGRKAHITSTYAMTGDFLRNIPLAYEGSFQMRGTFGFLRRYQFESIEGGGTQIFNIDTGVLEKDHQKYTLHVGADLALPLGDSKPVLTIEQTISIELLQ
ncbi:MAG: hypothetical protein GXY41_10360 [Phycisphaerae bacterium]|nr:hypothetical protein [Phycisphaerae bacterium]